MPIFRFHQRGSSYGAKLEKGEVGLIKAHETNGTPDRGGKGSRSENKSQILGKNFLEHIASEVNFGVT